MGSDHGTCDLDLLMGYMDQELSMQERAQVEKHLEECPHCQNTLRQQEALSVLFKEKIDRVAQAAPLHRVEEDIVFRVQKQAGRKGKKRSTFWSRRVLVPAGAFAVALVSVLLLSRYPTTPEPSAVINSFTAETSSVMILETPETRRTILWFQEMPGQDGEDDGMEQV